MDRKSLSCPACNQTNDCGRNSSCWCFQYPSLGELRALLGKDDNPKSDVCFCKSCFEKELSSVIDQLVVLFRQGDLPNFALPYASNKQLLEGLDYYLEDGKYVFTSWSHLKRGHCCGSGCRHCPYPKN